MVVDGSGYLCFQRNSKKQVAEAVFEVLESFGNASKMDVIAQAVNERFPDLQITPEAVRSIVLRDKDTFICFGRTSTYGLRKWEEERDNLRGGTIRDMVEYFLRISPDPKHIAEVTDYVNKFRNTSVLSVMRNIDAELGGRFRIFPGEFIGINGKNYENTDRFRRVSGSHFRIALFKKMDGWDIEQIITYFQKEYRYDRIQVRYIIEKKIEAGELSLSKDNKLCVWIK